MKKLISGVLSLFLLGLALAVPAYAENNAANDRTPPRSTTMQDRTGVNDVTDLVPGMDNTRNDTDMFRFDDRTDRTDNNGRLRAAATGDNAMDWGWLGLLGLIGLVGLRGGNRQRT
ncbi:MAG TPA: WGxxGxxG family protein [Paenibacillaceae bacterium]